MANTSGSSSLVRPEPYKKISETHKLMAKFAAAGWTVKRIIKQVGLPYTSWERLMATREFVELLTKEKELFISRVWAEETKDPTRAQIRKLVKPAVARAKKIITSKDSDDGVAVKAIDTVFKHSAEPQKQQGCSGVAVQINLTSEKVSDLERMGAEAAFLGT